MPSKGMRIDTADADLRPHTAYATHLVVPLNSWKQKILDGQDFLVFTGKLFD